MRHNIHPLMNIAKNMERHIAALALATGFLTCMAEPVPDSRVRRVSVVNGLKSNDVYCILQDTRGFVWFGTSNGLSRYDGYRFANFTQLSPDPRQATDKRIGNMTLSPDGTRLYAVTSTKDTAIYDISHDRFIGYRRAAAAKGRTTAGDITMAGINGYRFVADRQGWLTIIHPSGFRERLHLIPHTLKNRANNFSVAANSNGLFYIATYGAGLYTYKPSTRRLEHFTATDARRLLTSNLLTCVTVDRQDNVWVGCEAVGACCIRTLPDVLASYVCPEPDSNDELANNIRCIQTLPDGRILVGAKSGRNYWFDPHTRQFKFAFDQGNALYCYLEDSRGRSWKGTQAERVFDIVEDPCGRIWRGTMGNGLWMDDVRKGLRPRHSVYLDDNPNTACVRDLELAHDGRMWIATSDGLLSVDAGKPHISASSFHRQTIGGILTNEEVDLVHCSPKGWLWIGVLGKGLIKARWQKGSLRLLQTVDDEHGLPINNVRSVVELPSGDLWVGMDEGVCKVSCDGMTITPYRLTNDMEGNVFNENAAAMASDGTVLLGSRRGLLTVKGQQKPTTGFVASVAVTDLAANGISLLKDNHGLGQEIRLDHRKNSIEISFSDFNFAQASSRLYQYYLEGIDNGWLAPTGRNTASYDNLPPGRYVFHVKKQGQDDRLQATMAIVILRPWWATWWARAICVLCAGALGLMLFRNGRERIRLQRKMAMDKQLYDFRINLFTRIAHEFRTPAAIIQTAVERMKDNGRESAALRMATRGTQRMSRLVAQLMDFRRINTKNMRLQVAEGNVTAFIRHIHQDHWDMAKRKEQSFVFTPFERDFIMMFDAKVLESILYNLLSNAVKYTPTGGSIQTKVSLGANNTLTVSVENTGPAISSQQLEHLFEPFMHGYVSQGGMGIGLYMAHSMAKLHHGQLDYARQNGLTIFKLTLPTAQNEYSDAEKSTTSVTRQENTESESAYGQVKEMLPLPLNSYHIAVVEDDYDMMEQMTAELGRYFHIDAYTDGASAVEGITNQVPSLILCDVVLPGMDGYEVARRIRSDAKSAHVPIIIITSLDDDNHQIKAYQAGADDYMLKPCSYRVLLTRIVQLLKRTAQKKNRTSPVDGNGTSPVDGNDTGSDASTNAPRLLLSIEDKRFLEQMDAIIAKHIADADFGVSVLADLLAVGRTTLFERVKRLTDITPNKYIQKAKMEHARKLLTDTDLSVTEVGYKIGVNDSAYFYRMFKAWYGLSPSQYRKRKI